MPLNSVRVAPKGQSTYPQRCSSGESCWMAQKAACSGSSQQNSLCPWRDWAETHGEAMPPQTAISWPLAIGGIVGESEEAAHRSLSTHEPDNPEERESALLLKKWLPLAVEQKQRIFHPALFQGKEQCCLRHLLKKSSFSLLLYCRELLGEVLDRPAWEMGGSRKHTLSTSLISTRLSQSCSSRGTTS